MKVRHPTVKNDCENSTNLEEERDLMVLHLIEEEKDIKRSEEDKRKAK